MRTGPSVFCSEKRQGDSCVAHFTLAHAASNYVETESRRD